jgi:predicted GH43/DUF377 family glycosyl hydrolase
MQNWKKLGLIYNNTNSAHWQFSHAANPVPYILNKEKGTVRVYHTSRSKENLSFIGFVDIDFKNDFKIINKSETPLVEPGDRGLFDDSGTAMGCIIENDNKFFLFYLGWNLKVTVPWLNTIGLAISDSPNGPFIKNGNVPLMDRSEEDPYSISYPAIIEENNRYKMWYGSNLSWGSDQKDMNHIIKYAESRDLFKWQRTNQIHIPLIHPNEYALSKPWVLMNENIYQMWYSFRGNGDIETYRIGYAESIDGKNWTRKDNEVGIDVSLTGWDSEMICYPAVFELNGNTYMLYNGNGYGKTGFGIAILEK